MQQDLNNHVKTQVLTPEEIARSYPHASPPVYSYQGSFYLPIEREEEDLSFCPSRGKIINKEPMHDPNTGEVIGYKMFWQKEYEKKPPEPFLSIMLWEYEGTPEDKEREERENVPIFNRKYRYYPVNIPYKKFHTRPDTGVITAIDIMVEKKEEKF